MILFSLLSIRLSLAGLGLLPLPLPFRLELVVWLSADEQGNQLSEEFDLARAKFSTLRFPL